MASLSLRELGKSFGDVEAVRGVDLEIADGELFVLVGPSGSGKSTVLRLIAGLEQPSAGSVEIGGADVTRLPPNRRDVGMVFQSYALFPHRTVRENIGFGLEARKADRIGERVGAVATQLGLEGLLDRLPRQLSGGERQRVALARALVREPEVLLMDEPLSNLDAQLRASTRAEIHRLQREVGTTTVYVTHDQAEALALGDRIGVMRGGELAQVGPPREVYDRPANVFVASFVGTPPMNLRTRPDGKTAGVRPEHVHLRGSRWAPQPTHPPQPAKVELVEQLGDQAHVILDADGARLVARVEPGFEARPGDTVEFWLDHVHVFGEDGGRLG